ncbi:MAG TPA: 6-pyruvoyl-tetrahydropterin synthase-related protein, partial [Terriglobales bacterium]|nr:6-pyruvoyl-tetrahydropterin synthase-related protein [Terriglobales bacterium]
MADQRRSAAIALLLIAGFTLCVVLSFLKLGIPSGHDFEFHFNSWIEVVDHWRQGNLYPHWAAMAHFGYGEARFIFYPPLSWTVGALLGLILPWKLVPAAYIWVVLMLAGWSMFLLARMWLPQRDAIFAAVLYAANPYHLVIVYWRSAMAELMAAIYLPLLLLFVLRAEKDARRIVFPLSLLMAAGWLTNLPSAVMMNYSAVLLAVIVAARQKSIANTLCIALSLVLGALLAGFYLLPAFHEQSWVNISQVLAPGVRPLDNFLFTATEDADHNRFNLLISIVAIAEIVILAAVVAFRRRFEDRKLWVFLTLWSVFCAALMLRITLPLWDHLPELRFVQFPWRWLLCLDVPFAIAITFVLRRWWMRAAVCALSLAVVLVVWHRVQVPWWDNAADIQEMLDNQSDRIGNEGTDEYVPAGADPYDIDKDAPLVRFEGHGDAHVAVQKWFAERRDFTATASSNGELILRLFNYPSWEVRVNGQEVNTEKTAHAGQMVIPIIAGENRVEINFVQGWDRRFGVYCSLIALVMLVIWPTIALRKVIAAS